MKNIDKNEVKWRPGASERWVVERFYWLLYILSLVLRLVEAVGETALAAVVPVEVAGHEDAGATLVSWALATETVDLTVLVDLTGTRNDQCQVFKK